MQPAADADALALKPSHALAQPPAERSAASSPAAADAMTAHARTVPDGHGGPAPMPQEAATSWLLGAGLLVATAAWLFERRRRRLLMTEKDSVMWADVQPPGSSIITTAGGLDAILPDSPSAAEKAREIYVAQISETSSRREATLIDLHLLNAKLRRRREKGDHVAALLLLQQHLVDFRYTSPWVFLELREQYLQLGRQKEWDAAREAFKQRFGQNAPVWTAPSTEHVEFAHDLQLCKEIVRCWPYREARIFILRWMLGDPESRQRAMGPPLLALGVYRDMMLLDHILDEVMVVRPRQADPLL